MLLAVTGLTREAKIIKNPDIKVVIGGGHNLDSKLTAALNSNVQGIISIGIAGGLATDLKPGDCVIAQEIVFGPDRRPTDAAWLQNLLLRLPFARAGVIAGTDHILADAQSKAIFRANTNAQATDMETHIAARAAHARNIPFAALRVISDAHDHTLPPAALNAMKPDGGINYGAVIGSVLLKPWQIPALMRTARDANKAFAALLRCRDLLGPRLGFPDLG
jgi:hopanoid-associated phosphorylase